ncbi:MAG TPA: hypothetical protein VHB02_06220 [Acidimicrobiales bacterium]|nr:hypothetical protein [Acidimicrobiales bacterium]
MSPTYASATSVSVETSRSEIERTLVRYGATAFAYGWRDEAAMIEFAAADRRVRFVLPLPARDDPAFWTTPARRTKRSSEAAYKEWEQACRQRWRALALVIKAKLEAVEAGISEFEDEFLAHIVLPDGTTAGQWLRPQIADAYETGRMPSFLPELGSGS